MPDGDNAGWWWNKFDNDRSSGQPIPKFKQHFDAKRTWKKTWLSSFFLQKN